MVYGYVRVSTNLQDTASQKIGVERKAKELRVNIDEYIADDGISGIVEYTKRELGGLIDRLKEGDIVIVSEVSRLARSVYMLFRIVEDIVEKKGCIVYAVKEGQMLRRGDVVTAIILSAYGTAAQIEREMIVKRVREGHERIRSMGYDFKRPLRVFSIKKKVSAVTEKVVELYKQGVSIRGIARETGRQKTTILNILDRENIRPRTKVETPQYLCFKENINIIRKKIEEGLDVKTVCKYLDESGILKVSKDKLYKYMRYEGLVELYVEVQNKIRKASYDRYNGNKRKNKTLSIDVDMKKDVFDTLVCDQCGKEITPEEVIKWRGEGVCFDCAMIWMTGLRTAIAISNAKTQKKAVVL